MNRDEALKAVKAKVTTENSVKHMLAAEAIMRALARHFGEDEEAWGLAGPAARYRPGIIRRRYEGPQ